LEEVPPAPIAFVHQSAESISGLEEFMQAVQLLGPRASAPEPGRRPLRTSISLITVPEGRIEPLPDAGAGDYPLDWSADGVRLLVGREREGAVQLFEWNRLTRAWDRKSQAFSVGSAALGAGPIRLALVASSPLADGDTDAQAAVVVDVDREGQIELPGSQGGRDPDISPDGRSVLYLRPDPRGAGDPFMMLGQPGSAEPRALGRGDRARFSRDGGWIVYVTHRRGNADVWMMRADGSAKRPVVTSRFDDDFPSLSPDGRFVVYASAREGDVSQLYVTRVADGTEVQLTHIGQNGRPVW
jgi:hypothetical protein